MTPPLLRCFAAAADAAATPAAFSFRRGAHRDTRLLRMLRCRALPPIPLIIAASDTAFAMPLMPLMPPPFDTPAVISCRHASDARRCRHALRPDDTTLMLPLLACRYAAFFRRCCFSPAFCCCCAAAAAAPLLPSTCFSCHAFSLIHADAAIFAAAPLPCRCRLALPRCC